MSSSSYSKLRRYAEKEREVVAFRLGLATAFMVTRCLIQRARARYHWPDRLIARRLT